MAKRFNCPYCNTLLVREKLVDHIEDEHEDMIPENWTAYRVVYDIVNDKHGYGNCTICGKPTKWNEKRQKYERLCGDPQCAKKIKERYAKNMLRVYNKVHLLDDPEHQEKMLAHRHISGKYKWSDGKIMTYTGSYEKELMEFLDKTLEYRSDEVLAPGPILEYDFEGKKRHWITDFLIIPYNLIIEVKDGGNNPNKRNMPIYRAKQFAKEKMITNMGTYSYLRLTNKDFGQLLGALAELKKKTLDKDDSPLYRIHEALEQDIDVLGEHIQTLIPELQMLSEFFSSDFEVDDRIVPFLSYTPTDRFIDDPNTGETMYESAIISPTLYNKGMETMINGFIDSLMEQVKSRFDTGVTPHYYWLNEDNHLEGIGIGLLFE